MQCTHITPSHIDISYLILILFHQQMILFGLFSSWSMFRNIMWASSPWMSTNFRHKTLLITSHEDFVRRSLCHILLSATLMDTEISPGCTSFTTSTIEDKGQIHLIIDTQLKNVSRFMLLVRLSTITPSRSFHVGHLGQRLRPRIISKLLYLGS